MLTGEIKKILIDTLVPMIEEHKRRRAAVTEEVLRDFMTVRELQFE